MAVALLGQIYAQPCVIIRPALLSPFVRSFGLLLVLLSLNGLRFGFVVDISAC